MMSAETAFLLVGIVGVCYSTAVTYFIIRDTVRLRALLRTGEVDDADGDFLVESWVRKTSSRRQGVAYLFVACLLVAILIIPDGIRGIWLPFVLFLPIWALGPAVRKQQAGYAKLLFGKRSTRA